MDVENGCVIISEAEVVQYGPRALKQCDELSPWLTWALAYCYLDWQAQQRATDDGMPARVWL
jgi:hypothetical protein